MVMPARTVVMEMIMRHDREVAQGAGPCKAME